MLPQLGQAWQEPARCIWMPHCMQSGALTSATGFGALASRRSSSSASVEALSIDGGSGVTSWPWMVSVTVSSTPGSVGWVRSAMVWMPSSARSSSDR